MNPELLFQTLSLLDRLDDDDLRALTAHLCERVDTDDVLAIFARRGNLRGMRILKKTTDRSAGPMHRITLDIPLTRANREHDLLKKAEALQRLASEMSGTATPTRRRRSAATKGTHTNTTTTTEPAPGDPHRLGPQIERYRQQRAATASHAHRNPRPDTA